ncbi:MAG: N-acetylmuramoyl-L-alanine amidase [Oscillospiraceae bacterium]|nr:N-acetylmuramoyl-L-alanine amidase [Oscillospiraceae bacterium]
MKKFFLNKKLMTFVLSFSLFLVIGGIAVFAAFQSGLPGVEMILSNIDLPLSSESSSSDGESSAPEFSEPEGTDVDLNGDINIAPVEPIVPSEPDEPVIDNVVEGPVVYRAPERMMAITLAPGIDYYTEENMSAEDIQKSIDKALEDAKALSANTVFLETTFGDKVLYTSIDMPQAETSIDMLKYAAEKAKSMELYVYVVFDVLNVSTGGAVATSDVLNSEQLALISENASAISQYDIDGIMLNTYTVESGGNAYMDYTRYGSGMGYENYLRSNVEAAVTAAYNAVKKEDPSIAVGIAVDAVWANSETIEEGSATTAGYQSFVNGFANTKKFVEEGLADFVAVKSDYATGNKNAKFADYMEWWNGVVPEEVPLYIFQYATKACSDEKGWSDPSELSDQVIAAEKLSGFKGSVFDSLSALQDNPKQSTDALVKYLTENIDPSFLLTQLELTRPSKKTFSTYDTVVVFAGASDVNFDLIMNGEKVKRDSNGAFMLTIELEPGLNTFTFEHKEKTITYNITRNVMVLKEVTPLGNVTVGGGMSITVTALAYEGSVVTATLGGTTITLTQSTEADDTTEEEQDSTYVIYTGMLSAPAAGSAEQGIGNIVIKGVWEDTTETKEAAYVTVSAKAKAGGLVEVIAKAAETFPTDVLNDLSAYDCYPLAKGTRDYIVGDEIVYVEGSNTFTYYNLQSGQRVYTKDVSPVSGELGGNKISNMTVSANGRYTYVIFEMSQQVAYVAKYSSSEFSIDFFYTDSVPGNLNLNCTPLFSSAKWNGSKLSLALSTKSGFLGYTAYYENGNLVFRFNNPTGTYSLSGVPIVVDVGHSALGVGALGFLSDYGEYEINLAVGRYLKEELQSRGATVYMMDTVNSRPSLEDRVAYASGKDPLVFVSVHCNSATSSSGYGTECFYFTRFSQNLASYFSSEVASALGTKNRGDMIGRYYVTRIQEYPSVLGELGFVSNESDYYKLIKSSYQREIAAGIADAISSYLYGAGKNGVYNYGTQSTNGESYVSSSGSVSEQEPPSSSGSSESSGSSSNSESSESSSSDGNSIDFVGGN